MLIMKLWKPFGGQMFVFFKYIYIYINEQALAVNDVVFLN